MPLSYRAKLRRDLRHWQALGLIQPEQVERISAVALAPRGLQHLQAILALCILLLFAPSIIAFVAANWSAMSPLSRMTVLFLGNAGTVLVTYLAVRRHERNPPGSTRRIVDGLATLSLVFAAATLALVGQAFHVPADPRSFAGALALMGLMTALVARSGAYRSRRGPIPARHRHSGCADARARWSKAWPDGGAYMHSPRVDRPVPLAATTHGTWFPATL